MVLLLSLLMVLAQGTVAQDQDPDKDPAPGEAVEIRDEAWRIRDRYLSAVGGRDVLETVQNWTYGIAATDYDAEGKVISAKQADHLMLEVPAGQEGWSPVVWLRSEMVVENRSLTQVSNGKKGWVAVDGKTTRIAQMVSGAHRMAVWWRAQWDLILDPFRTDLRAIWRGRVTREDRAFSVVEYSVHPSARKFRGMLRAFYSVDSGLMERVEVYDRITFKLLSVLTYGDYKTFGDLLLPTLLRELGPEEDYVVRQYDIDGFRSNVEIAEGAFDQPE